MANHNISPSTSFSTPVNVTTVDGYDNLELVTTITRVRWLISPVNSFSTIASGVEGPSGPSRPSSGLVYPIILS